MAKQINKLQLEAVVATIKEKLVEQDNILIESCRESIKNSKKYKKFCSIFEDIKEIEDQIECLVKQKQTNQKQAADLMENDRYFYYSDYDYLDFNRREEEFISLELDNLNTPLKANNFNSDKVKNEILIASIDSEFNIQNFIDKYSK